MNTSRLFIERKGLPLLRLFPLHFQDEKIEQTFCADYALQIRLQTRISLLLGACVFLLLGVVDVLLVKALVPQLWLIRVIQALALLGHFALTFLPRFMERHQLWLALHILFAGGGVLWMIALVPMPAAAPYFVGLITVIIWAYSFSGLRFLPAFCSNIILVVAYLGLMLQLEADPAVTWVNLVNLIAASCVLAVGGYLIEWHRRGMFALALSLEGERQVQEHRAMYDALTNLPNRVLFEQHLERALAHAKRHETALAVLFVDINDFKPVNDRYGHQPGDQLLQQIAARLSLNVRGEDTVARIGGDEFLVLMEDIKTQSEAVLMAERLSKALEQPFILPFPHGPGIKVCISASIGIGTYPWDGDSSQTLIRHADKMMYQSKSQFHDQLGETAG